MMHVHKILTTAGKLDQFYKSSPIHTRIRNNIWH